MGMTRIATSARAEINALCYQGIIASECYAQIYETIRRKDGLGLECASLFAEPVSNTKEGFIDWYVEQEGEIIPFEELEGERKEKAANVIRERAKRIRDYAQTLISSDDAQKSTRGNILQLALLYPGEKNLFLVGGEPVVTCWGFSSGKGEDESNSLCDLTRPSPACVQKTTVPVRSSWIRWLLPLFLLLLLLLLLVSRIGQVPAFSGHSLLHFPSFLEKTCELNAQLEYRIQDLEMELLEVQKKLDAHMKMCVPKVAEKKPLPRVKDELVIPNEVKDTRFMRGEWLCDTGLVNSKTGEPVRVKFSFDDMGKGEGIIYEPNDVCRGSASVKMEDNALRIHHDALRCAKTKSSYEKNTIICRKNELGKTECHGMNADGHRWRALFYKAE